MVNKIKTKSYSNLDKLLKSRIGEKVSTSYVLSCESKLKQFYKRVRLICILSKFDFFCKKSFTVLHVCMFVITWKLVKWKTIFSQYIN